MNYFSNKQTHWMQALKKDGWLVVLLLVLAVPLFFLNMHNTHTAGGDDYALYINEARNIAEGKPYYETSYVFNKYNNCYSPPQYPPGYPLLLAPAVKMWGIGIMQFCIFNTVVAALLMLCFFYYCRKHMGAVAAASIAVMISYSGIMVGLKEIVVADTTCLLFAMLYLILRHNGQMSAWRMALMILCATMAILTRTQAILLLVAEGGVYLLNILIAARKGKAASAMRAWQGPAIAIASLALLWVLNKTVFYCPRSASGFYADFLRDTWQKGLLTIVRDNVNFFLESVKAFFHYDTDNSIRTAMVTVMESAGLVLCMVGFGLSVARRVTFDDVFFMLMCGMVLYYPIHDTRYFLPAMPIVFVYCYRALRSILPALTTIPPMRMGIVLTVFYLFAGLKFLRGTTMPPTGYVPQAADHQAFSYLQQHVKDDEIIICARPRLVALYTGRKCIIHAWQHPMAENKRVFDSMNAKYLLVAYGIVEDYYHEYLNQHQHPMDSMDIAAGYRLYRLR